MNVRHVALTAALLAAFPLAAQTTTAPATGGPYAPIILLLPAGTRTLAMGNTGVVSRDDDALFFNPAMLTIARGTSVSYERYGAGVEGGSLSSVTRFNTGGIAVGVRMVNYHPAVATFPTERGDLGDRGFAQSSIEALAGIAQVFKGFRVGATGKLAQDNGASERLSRAALDLGISKDYFQSYTVGLAVQNIGSDLEARCGFVEGCVGPASSTTTLHLPLRTTLGVSTQRPVGEFDLAATAALGMYRADFFAPSGGAELGYSWLDGYSIALRAGARRPLPGEGALTAGAGFTMDRLSIDYALETLSASRVAHRIGLRVR